MEPIFYQPKTQYESDDPYTKSPKTWRHASLLLGLDNVNKKITSMGPLAVYKSTHREMEELYLNFLHDPERAGKYHINPEVYARVALQCIMYICGEYGNSE